MKALLEFQKKARAYRKQGKSIKEISKIINKPQSSISNWVKKVKLTDNQKLLLLLKNPVHTKAVRLKAIQSNIKTWRDRRLVYQDYGRKLVKEKNTDFIAGIMLYWAEGSKNRNSLKFSNTDINMMKFFTNFIFKFFDIREEDLCIQIHCHLNNGLTLDCIEKYWLTQLNVSKAKLQKAYIEQKRVVSGKRKNIHVYGVCSIIVNRTDIVQKIFGAIQEYIGFNNPDWLNNGGVAQSVEHHTVNVEAAGS